MKVDFSFRFIILGILMCIFYKANIYLIFLFSILIHELAHLVFGICMGLKVRLIKFSLLGISLEFMNYKEKDINLKKIIILLMGPMFNFIMAFIFYYMDINNNLKISVVYSNIALGIFNLMPVLPLDGGRILKEILNKKLDYKSSNIISLNISKIFLVLLSLIYSILIFKIKNILIFFIIIYLWYLYFIEERKLRTFLKVYRIIEKV